MISLSVSMLVEKMLLIFTFLGELVHFFKVIPFVRLVHSVPLGKYGPFTLNLFKGALCTC